MNTTITPSAPQDAPRLTISELARLARTTRDTLLFYDRIGLLVPESRGANRYRYYSERELLKVNLIRTFQSFGMSLKDIKAFLEDRNPETVLAALSEQMGVIRKRQDHLEQAYSLLEDFRDVIGHALDLDEDAIVVRRCVEKAILVAPKNDYTHGRVLWDNILDSYRFFQGLVTPLETNYPVWSIYEKESVQAGRWRFPDHFYMNSPRTFDQRRADAPFAIRDSKRARACAKKEAGWYVSGCARGRYGDSSGLFRRLLAFIKEKGLEMAGRSYVDYPLNEIAVKNSDEYLIQISIAVTAPPATTVPPAATAALPTAALPATTTPPTGS
jgi:DNA-binding transcriptional MerR regulator